MKRPQTSTELETSSPKRMNLVQVDETWLLETFEGVVTTKNASTVLSQLHSIDPDLRVGGLTAIGLAEAEEHAMEKAGIPFVVRVEIKRFAKERTADAASTTSKPPLESFATFNEFVSFLEGFPATHLTSVENSSEQARLLKRFNLPGDEGSWPVISLNGGKQWKIDLELLPSLLDEGAVRPSAAALLRALDTPYIYYLMLAVSGSGKTSALADVARTHFVIYVQCMSVQEAEIARKSRGQDAGYAWMLKYICASPGNLDSDVESNAQFAERLFMIEIVCRLAQLYVLVKRFPNISPFEFYVHQKAIGDTWTNKLRRELKDLTSLTCERLVEEMRAELEPFFGPSRKLVYAIDEIEAAALTLENRFDADKLKRKGILSPMIRALASLETVGKHCVIFTGTASSFERGETIKSSLNKGSLLRTIELTHATFPTVSLQACKRFFNKLNLGDIFHVDDLRDDLPFDRMWTIDEFDPVSNRHTRLEDLVSYAIIGSRFRTLTRVLDYLVDLDDPGRTKAEALRVAIFKSIQGLRDDLVMQFQQQGGAREGPALVEGTRMNSILVAIWTSMCLKGGHVTLPSAKASIDLMKLGVGNFDGDVDTRRGRYVISETIVADAIRKYAELHPDRMQESSFEVAKQAFEGLLSTYGNIAARGNLFETLIFEALRSKPFQDVPVGELPFVKSAAVASSTESPWWTTTIFKASIVQRSHDQQRSTPSFLASPDAQYVVYSPETVARFDAVVMLGGGHALTLAATIWSKTVPGQKAASQVLSTDLSKAYFLADGSALNKNCTRQRTEWESLGLHRTHAVRVHVALPTFSEAGEFRGASSAVPDHDLVVHLDSSNCHLLFGPDRKDLYRLLAIATDTPYDQWVGLRS